MRPWKRPFGNQPHGKTRLSLFSSQRGAWSKKNGENSDVGWWEYKPRGVEIKEGVRVRNLRWHEKPLTIPMSRMNTAQSHTTSQPSSADVLMPWAMHVLQSSQDQTCLGNWEWKEAKLDPTTRRLWGACDSVKVWRTEKTNDILPKWI